MKCSEFIRLDMEGTLENLFNECRRCKTIQSNLSGKRTEKISITLSMSVFSGVADYSATLIFIFG